MGACCSGGRRPGEARPFVRIGCRAAFREARSHRDGYWDWGYLGGKKERQRESRQRKSTDNGGGIIGKIRQEGQKPGPGRGTMRSHRRTQGVIATYRTTLSAHSAKVPGTPLDKCTLIVGVVVVVWRAVSFSTSGPRRSVPIRCVLQSAANIETSKDPWMDGWMDVMEWDAMDPCHFARSSPSRMRMME